MAQNNLQSVAFPKLYESPIAQFVSCTAVAAKRYRDGDTLIAIGERDLRFFIVKSGARCRSR